MSAKRFINEKQLVCPHCEGELFDERQVLLDTAGMAFLKLDWLNKSATVFVCCGCGRLEWFLDV